MLFYLYKVGIWMAFRMSRKTGYKIASFVADVFYLFVYRDKRNLGSNLEVVLQTKDKKRIKTLVRETFRNFAKYLFDFFRFDKLSRHYIISHLTIDGKEYLDRALAEGKGVILLTAHLGNWELGGAVVGSLGYPLNVIALDHKDKRINDIFLRHRRACDVKVIPIGAQLKNCFRVLKKGKILAIVGDRDFSNHGVEVDFFGRPALLPKGPAIFSLKTGAPIMPTFIVREKDDNCRMIIDKPVEYAHTGNKDVDVKNLMGSYVSVIEKYIRAYPDQWYAFRRMWD